MYACLAFLEGIMPVELESMHIRKINNGFLLSLHTKTGIQPNAQFDTEEFFFDSKEALALKVQNLLGELD